MPGKVYRLGYIWRLRFDRFFCDVEVLLGCRVKLPSAVLIEIVGDVIRMGHVLHLAVLHLWAGTEGKWDEGLVWTKMFLRYWKPNLGLVGKTDLVSGSDWSIWKWNCRFCLNLLTLGRNWMMKAGGFGLVLGVCMSRLSVCGCTTNLFGYEVKWVASVD